MPILKRWTILPGMMLAAALLGLTAGCRSDAYYQDRAVQRAAPICSSMRRSFRPSSSISSNSTARFCWSGRFARAAASRERE